MSKINKKLNITIIGIGLIGGSLGLLLKQKLNCHIIGFAGSEKTLRQAKKIGAIDENNINFSVAVKKADFIFICTPISQMKRVFKKLSLYSKIKAIIVDVASTKTNILKQAQRFLPSKSSFIASHPMAGKEKNGINQAEAGLLPGCTWALTPNSHTKKAALEKIKNLLIKLGCRPFIVSANWHDQTVALISHLPAILSSTLSLVAGQESGWKKKQILAATGFRDASRVAGCQPELSADFCLANRKNLNILLKKTINQLKKLKDNLLKNDREKVFAFFSKAQQIRNDWFYHSRFSQTQNNGQK